MELTSLKDKKNKKKYQSHVSLAVLLLLIGVSVAIHQFKVPPIMVGVAKEVGLPSEKAPMLMSVFMLVCLVFAIPAGIIVERIQVKWTLLLSATLAAIGSIIGALSTVAPALLFSRAIEGLGFLLISIAIPVAAASYSHPKKIGAVMGICGVWISVGSILAFNTVPALNVHFKWRGIWWIYALLTLIVVIYFFFAFKGKDAGNKSNRENNLSSNDNKEKAKIGMGEAVRNRNLIFPSFGFLIYNFNLMAMITFFPIFATGAGLMSIGKASFIASLPMILSLIGSPIFGQLADRVGHRWLYSFTLLSGGIGVALMFIKSMPAILVGASILGLIGAASPSLMFSSLGKLITSRDLLAQSNGIVVLFQNGGMFLASLFFGLIAQGMGGNYTVAAMLMIPLTIISSVLVYFTSYDE